MVLCESVRGASEAEHIAQRMIEAFGPPVPVPGGSCEVGLSVGIACTNIPGTTPDALFRLADQAMYRAKQAGKSTHHTVIVPSPR